MGKKTKKPGRPTRRSERVVREVLARVERGESVEKICRRPEMPAETTWYNWLSNDRDLQARYIEANRIQTLKLEDQMVPIADNCKLDKASIAKARLRINARERKIGRMANKVYGKAGSWEEVGEKEVLPPIVKLRDLRAPAQEKPAPE